MIEVCFNITTKYVLDEFKSDLQSEAVLCLGRYFSIGDLTQLAAERSAKVCARLNSFCYSDFTSEEFDECYEAELEQLRADYDEFEKYLTCGEPVRVWIEHNADAYTAFRWFCYEMNDRENTVYLVTQPSVRYDIYAEKFTKNFGWAGDCEHMVECAAHAVEISRKEYTYYSEEWESLVRENTPMRVLINDEIVGVGIDFFDSFILDCIVEMPAKEAKIIGNVLGKCRLEVGFVAERIEGMIERGLVKVDEDISDEDGYKWPRVISRA